MKSSIKNGLLLPKFKKSSLVNRSSGQSGHPSLSGHPDLPGLYGLSGGSGHPLEGLVTAI